MSNDVSRAILNELDFLIELIPEIEPMIGFEQHNIYHCFDVFNHTLEVLKNTPNSLEIRLAALFHDIGKPNTYSIDKKGVGHFYGHSKVSEELTKIILERLEYNEFVINNVLTLVYYHDYQIGTSNKSINKFLKQFNHNLIEELFQLKYADAMGQNPKFINRVEELQELKYAIEEIYFSNKEIKKAD